MINLFHIAARLTQLRFENEFTKISCWAQALILGNWSSQKRDQIACKLEFAAVLACAVGAVTVRPEKQWAKRAFVLAIWSSSPVRRNFFKAWSPAPAGRGLEISLAKIATNVLRLRVRFLLCQVTHLSANPQKMERSCC